MIHQEGRHRLVAGVDDAVFEPHLAGHAVDPPEPLYALRKPLDGYDVDIGAAFGIAILELRPEHLRCVAGGRSVQRIDLAVAPAGDWLAMADMVRPAGEEKPLK